MSRKSAILRVMSISVTREYGYGPGRSSLTFWFLLLLGVAWVAVFLPAALRAREAAPLSATQRFKRRMDLIAPPGSGTGRWVVVPHSTNELRAARFRRTQQRRRKILEFLLGSSALSLVPALVLGGVFVRVGVAFATSLVVYVVLLIGTKRQRQEAAATVRSMERQRPPSAERVVFHEPVTVSGGSRR
jgi:hypothetical protein